jgi:transaldolase
MKYFLDSAILDEIRYACKNWAIAGITTNPNHIKTSGKPLFTVIKEIAAEFDGVEMPISVEINPHFTNAVEMVAAGRKIAALSPNFVIKIPCIEQGLVAAKELEAEGIRTNVTLVFNTTQAIQAARIGAYIVSPFIGWKETHGENAREYIKDIVEIYNYYGYETEIIAASVRDGGAIASMAKAGADIVTCGFNVYKESFYSPYTDFGIKKFAESWDATDTVTGSE